MPDIEQRCAPDNSKSDRKGDPYRESKPKRRTSSRRVSVAEGLAGNKVRSILKGHRSTFMDLPTYQQYIAQVWPTVAH